MAWTDSGGERWRELATVRGFVTILVVLEIVSAYGYSDTLQRLLDAISSRGLTVFAQIDHAAAARDVGMELADEAVLIFGNPRAGTPLMQEDPRIGIELPLRMLVWMREEAAVVGYNDPRNLARSYDINPQAAATLDAMSSLLADIANEVAGSGQVGATRG
jgi:uncharacterized protein (DUF302 family)